jgi:hypothetical protein
MTVELVQWGLPGVFVPQPITDNTPAAAGHAANRRVEIKPL